MNDDPRQDIYEPPTLSVLGSVSELTLDDDDASGGSFSDDGGGDG